MKEILRRLFEHILILGEVCWEVLGKNLILWLSEKIRPTFSLSTCENLPSTFYATFNRDKPVNLHISFFVFVKNHTNKALYLTEALQYVPARETCQIFVSVYLSKAKHYFVKKESIDATLCIKCNGSRKNHAKMNLQNITNKN